MNAAWLDQLNWTRRGLNRRRFLHQVSAAGMATGLLSIRDVVSLNAAELKKKHKAVIVLWMAGGPSQMETMDPKPDHENGGGTATDENADDTAHKAGSANDAWYNVSDPEQEVGRFFQ